MEVQTGPDPQVCPRCHSHVQTISSPFCQQTRPCHTSQNPGSAPPNSSKPHESSNSPRHSRHRAVSSLPRRAGAVGASSALRAKLVDGVPEEFRCALDGRHATHAALAGRAQRSSMFGQKQTDRELLEDGIGSIRSRASGLIDGLTSHPTSTLLDAPAISRLMVDPVRAPDGRHYERSTLRLALQQGAQSQTRQVGLPSDCRPIDPPGTTPTDRQSYGSPMECLGVILM